MDIIIRECIIDDVNDLYKLNKNDLGYDYPADLMKEKLTKILKSNKDKVYVAVIENKVVGYVHATDYDVMYMDHLKNIMGIAVGEKFRHLGIGKKLLYEVERWAKETGATGVRLNSGKSRIDAHEFYKRCGYINKKKQLNFIKILM